jgi:hypothetical protein
MWVPFSKFDLLAPIHAIAPQRAISLVLMSASVFLARRA